MPDVSNPKPNPQPIEPSGVRPRCGAVTARPKSREQLVGLLTIAPALFLILALTLYPVSYSIWLSLLE